jgi:hypothetical protein
MHISLAGFSTKWGKRKKKLFGFICEVYASIRYSIVFSTKAFARISLPRQRNYKVPITRQRKKNTPQVQQSLKTEPNQKETTKRLAPGGTGTQGRPTCTNYTQIKTSSSLQQGLPQQNEHTNTKEQECFKLPTTADLHM